MNLDIDQISALVQTKTRTLGQDLTRIIELFSAFFFSIAYIILTMLLFDRVPYLTTSKGVGDVVTSDYSGERYRSINTRIAGYV